MTAIYIFLPNLQVSKSNQNKELASPSAWCAQNGRPEQGRKYVGEIQQGRQRPRRGSSVPDRSQGRGAQTGGGSDSKEGEMVRTTSSGASMG